MKKYLAVFVAPLEAYDKMKELMQSRSPEQREEAMRAWKTWMENHKDNIVDNGGGVGSAKRISNNGEISNVRNEIGGYMIIQAEDANTAVNIFKDSPHSSELDGAVEVMEIMEM